MIFILFLWFLWRSFCDLDLPIHAASSIVIFLGIVCLFIIYRGLLFIILEGFKKHFVVNFSYLSFKRYLRGGWLLKLMIYRIIPIYYLDYCNFFNVHDLALRFLLMKYADVHCTHQWKVLMIVTISYQAHPSYNNLILSNLSFTFYYFSL